MKQIGTSSWEATNKLKDRGTAPDLLEEAKQIMNERATQRDSSDTGERSMEAIVKTFNALTGLNLTEAQGWEFMIVLKLVRSHKGKPQKDDYIDGISYLSLYGECRLSE